MDVKNWSILHFLKTTLLNESIHKPKQDDGEKEDRKEKNWSRSASKLFSSRFDSSAGLTRLSEKLLGNAFGNF
jgi:hypothetical protein